MSILDGQRRIFKSLRRYSMDTAIESKQPPRPVHQQPRHVHTITDRFSMANSYLIVNQRLIVVDPGSVLNVQLLLIYMQRFLKRGPDEIDLVVLTHLHPDHTSGVEELRHVTRAPVAASSVAKRLVDSWQDYGQRDRSGVSQFVGYMYSQVH